MLILTRRIDQAIWIGNVRVLVVGVERDRVKLGISAPEDTLVLREELMNQLLDDVLDHKPRRAS